MRLETIDGQTYIRNEAGRTFAAAEPRGELGVIVIRRNGEECEVDLKILLESMGRIVVIKNIGD